MSTQLTKGICSQTCVQLAKKNKITLTCTTLPDYCQKEFSTKEEMISFLNNFFIYLKDKSNISKISKLQMEEYLKSFQHLEINTNLNENNATTLFGKNNDFIQLINANEIPYIDFSNKNSLQNNLQLNNKSLQNSLQNTLQNNFLFSNVENKTQLFKNRFNFILNKLQNNNITITSINSLLGSKGIKYLLGMIYRKNRNDFILEDLTGSINLDISSIKSNEIGMIVEGNIILISGIYENKIFKCHVMVLPNIDDSKNSIVNDHLKIDENQLIFSKNSFMVICNEIYLDKINIIDKIKLLFNYFKYLQHHEENKKNKNRILENTPTLFIFIGNFLSKYSNYQNDLNLINNGLNKINKLINDEFKDYFLQNFIKICFIPGPNDITITPNNLLPQNKLFILNTLQNTLQNNEILQFYTNPLRIKYYNKDIIIFRKDLQNLMRRHSIIDNSFNKDYNGINKHLYEYVCETICSQSHLSPFTNFIQPTIWSLDHSLQLFPNLPNYLILADKESSDKYGNGGTLCFNPPAFPLNYSFYCFLPLCEEEPLQLHTLPNLNSDDNNSSLMEMDE
ncbi:hypothetical protein ABK040_009702 [Willaertia magna]